jgi:Xaa-Pro aminopeptidase
MNLDTIQHALRMAGLDGWLLLDFRGSNSIAWDILDIPRHMHCTRRWAVLIPATGNPVRIVHAIERFTLAHVPGTEIVYAGHEAWRKALADSVATYGKKIALEYSPLCAIPTAAKVDAGTVELLQMLGADIHSSADLLQEISALWSAEQIQENLEFTAPALYGIMMDTMDFISMALKKSDSIQEYEVQQFILNAFQQKNLHSYSAPIVAIDKNAASPHYVPSLEESTALRKDHCILLDMWAAPAHGKGTYSDITWMCYAGSHAPEQDHLIFTTIAAARDAGVNLLLERFESKQKVAGYEVDDAVRRVIEDQGFGQYFIHRTGHSITTETHGPGANMDNYETHDTRSIIPNTSFSIEPGIYIPNTIGMRTEIDMLILSDGKPIITGGPAQKELIMLF